MPLSPARLRAWAGSWSASSSGTADMTVLATARRLDRLEALAAELPPGRVITMAGDLADPGFRQELWERAVALPGGVDLLVNNAGVGHYAEFAEQDPARIRQIIELNLMALIDLSQKAARHMKARGAGQILEISSVLGFVGIAESAVYVGEQARGQRAGEEPAVRAGGDGGPGVGGLSGADGERVLGGGRPRRGRGRRRGRAGSRPSGSYAGSSAG